MSSKDILERFEQFLKENGDKAFSLISQFLDKERERFVEGNYESEIKARQGWVATVGRVLEDIISKMLEKFCNEQQNIGLTNDQALRNPATEQLERVRRNVEVIFGEYSLLPDGDIIIYCKPSCEVIAILSVKNSFRERYTETPYWKLKLKSSPITQHIKVFMITPDPDGEIAFTANGPRKARIVMEYELDGIYLAREEFDESNKVKPIEDLIPDLQKLLEERPCQ